jgi:FkbM family methyltransferase
MNNHIPTWMKKEVAEYGLVLAPAPVTILDIGANIGAFALRVHAQWPKAMVRCYEPVEENYQTLVKNISSCAKIRAYRFAIRGFNGADKILIGDEGVTCGFHQLGRQTKVTEKVMCVDAAKIPSAELVKIDTEGCEVEILSRLDLAKTRALVVEYHRPEDAGILKALALAAGFELLEELVGSKAHGILKFARLGSGVSLPKINSPSSLPSPQGEGELEGRTAAQGASLSVHVSKVERKIYCAVASHFSNHDLIFLQSMMQLILGATVRISFGWSCDPSVERARNVLTANFLASDCTHLLFIDSDIAFTPRDVQRIISHDEDVVGGIYPLKTQDKVVQWCGNGAEIFSESNSPSPRPSPQGEGESQGQSTARGPMPVRPDGLQEVGCIGTGFMCISRRAFEKIVRMDGAKIRYNQDWPPYREEFAFWRQTIREVNGKCRFLTEDWNFCYRYRELGGRIFADTQVILRHAGRAVWPLDLQNGNPFVNSDRKLNTAPVRPPTMG